MNEDNLSHNMGGGVLCTNCIPFIEKLIVYSSANIERCDYPLQLYFEFHANKNDDILFFE